jgi:hypothetical protein
MTVLINISSDAIFYDLGSSQGNRLDGKHFLKLHLQPGDKIQVGKTEILFSLGEYSSPKAERKDPKTPNSCMIS